MTPEHKAAKQQISRLAKRWACLIPTGWDVKHLYLETTNDNDDSHAIMAETKTQWEYQQASIRWHLPSCCGQEDSWIEGTMVHEMVHVLVAPMESQLPNSQSKLCEHTVETVAKAILRVTG